MGSNMIGVAGVDTYNIAENFAYERVERNMALPGGEGMKTKLKVVIVVFVLNR